MTDPAPASAVDTSSTPLGTVSLGVQERAVVEVLLANRGRVVSRRELARAAGLTEMSERRCDSVLVAVRRALGPTAIVNVRCRGWMLHPSAEDAAARLV
jgi:DNA-binding response OmpR family regulator